MDVRSIKEMDEDKSAVPLQDDSSVSVGPVKKFVVGVVKAIRDGNW